MQRRPRPPSSTAPMEWNVGGEMKSESAIVSVKVDVSPQIAYNNSKQYF